MDGQGDWVLFFSNPVINDQGMSDPLVLEESMPASPSHVIQPADGKI